MLMMKMVIQIMLMIKLQETSTNTEAMFKITIINRFADSVPLTAVLKCHYRVS